MNEMVHLLETLNVVAYTLTIIAACSVIRIIQNAEQLKMFKDDKKKRDSEMQSATDAFIEAMRK